MFFLSLQAANHKDKEERRYGAMDSKCWALVGGG